VTLSRRAFLIRVAGVLRLAKPRPIKCPLPDRVFSAKEVGKRLGLRIVASQKLI
jgi:hypothetical protein